MSSKKEIKVYLQYPWKFPDSSYYKNILDFPPKHIMFVNYKKKASSMSVIGSSRQFERMRKLKNMVRKILRILHVPNVVYTSQKNYDLIHAAHCLPLNKKPWIVDTEVYDRLASAGGNVASKGLGKWIIKKRLESPYCKKIICWSEDCKKTFIDAFSKNQKILDKLVLLPFALEKPQIKRKEHKRLQVLFVARWFDAKGGRQTLEVFDRLSKRYKNVDFIFICPTPDEFKQKYRNNKAIKILELMPQKKVFSTYYACADIFFYPGFGDSYGFAVPEALAFGIPVVSTKSFAKDELVKDGKTGFLVDLPKNWDTIKERYRCMDEKFIQDFVTKTSELIENKALRENMSKEARKEVISGLFSIEKRNKKLQEIYKEALE